MKSEKVYFGTTQPEEMEYHPLDDGFAEVWLYKNIIQDEEGNYEADGVCFRTQKTAEEVWADRERYFAEPDPETTMEDVIEALDILTELLVEEL